MNHMKMLGLAVLARAKEVCPTGEKHPANTTLSAKSGRPATAKEAKCPR
ncbi:MAG TPA: hypothetical protein VGH58_01595 [Solirubrobacterales bacterium]|jgi:hypothetical protein